MKRKLSIVFLLVGALMIIFSATSYSMKDNKEEKKENDVKEDTKKVTRSSDFTYHPPIYKVCDLNSCLHIVGYTKLGDEYVTNLDNKVEELIKKYNEVIIQANDTDIDQMEYIKNFVLPDGTSLDDVLEDSTIKKLTKFGKDHESYDYDKFKLYNIGFNYRSIENIIYDSVGINRDGIVTNILELINKNNKKYNVLETSNYDVKFINNYDNKLYVSLIDNYIDNFDKVSEEIEKAYNAYLDNDVDYLNKYYSLELDNITDEETLRYYTDKYLTKNEIFSYEVIGLLNDDIEKVMFFNVENMFGNHGLLTYLKDYNIELEK